ncbi:NLR family CARD domain-containing protein 3-like [Periophthalmus magnuspinnatus]|uniref:NLR family CARD domain-containing protein 3-like n=1 Tax=Periophthalmus magnuspinnatus TaxID=409849 RepID=UPI00243672A3|nr:NLR family CARD domain-containing protein 3-like [Periophthalmus magnuspinnatus]
METCVLPCGSDEGEVILIQWVKTEEDLLVHAFQYGTDQLQEQAETFRGRTSLFPEQISRGNASLQLSHVKVSDQGSYLCQTFTSNSGAKTWVHLRVKAEGPGGPGGPGGPVIGGSVGGALVLLLVVFFFFFFLWKRQKDKEPQNRSAEEEENLLEDRGGPAALELLLQETFGALSEEESLKLMSFLEDQSLMGEFSILHRNDVEKDDLVKSMVHVYGVHSITVTHRLLQKLQRKDLLKKLSQRKCDPEEIIRRSSEDMKSRLRQRFNFLTEDLRGTTEEMEFDEGFTELLITVGDSGQNHQDHEVIQMETLSRRPANETVQCQDMFKARPHSPKPIRVVLMKGVTGVGKTVLTQKLSLDWAEGHAHQDLQLLFPFTFRELNVLRDTQFSLVGLLHHFFSPSKDLCSFQQLQVLFIFDGLDECRPPLDFSRTRVLTDPTESASVHVLLVNLIRGSLLPSARLWITTRPAAANQIPAECVSMVTEVRGFTDPQKEQYFRKRFRNKARDVISHIKSIRSLHIMSHIPIFCWILSTVLQKLLEQTEEPELPRTLTQMYVHFLVVQAKVQNIKYHQGSGEDLHWTTETKKMVWSLGKLAFEQLQKGNLIFYECDLRECGLDAAAASVYSGVFTQVFREEPGLYQDKVYCFIHLSVQEFLAALHVHQIFMESGVNLLKEQLLSTLSQLVNPKVDLTKLHCSAVDQALQSPNGHLDLFLCFLLGLSLPTNQRLLQGLLTHTGSAWTNQETVKYIKQKLNDEGLSAEKKLNLLHCLNEMNDHSLVKEIQQDMRVGRLAGKNMSPAAWPALSFLLLSSDSDLEEFDLRKYQASERALLGLLPVVRASTKVLVSGRRLSPHSCGPQASVLSSSSPTHLDLSLNDLQDSGEEPPCSGLKSAPCSQETPRLDPPREVWMQSKNGLSAEKKLNKHHSLNEMNDLSLGNEKQEDLRGGPEVKVSSKEMLDPPGEVQMVSDLRMYSCEFSLDPNSAHRRLLLSEDKRTVTCVKVEQKGALLLGGEVERGVGFIAVSYGRIKRRGDESVFGHNDLSWSLEINRGECFTRHNKERTKVCDWLSSSGGVSSGRVGVFLDSEAGALSFYQVFSDGRLSHIWTFSSSFSEPLFPGFILFTEGSSVSVVNLSRT